MPMLQFNLVMQKRLLPTETWYTVTTVFCSHSLPAKLYQNNELLHYPSNCLARIINILFYDF